jgi:membrane-associated phospholipid phosphatase
MRSVLEQRTARPAGREAVARAAHDWSVPVLRPRENGRGERLARRLAPGHPVVVFIVAMLAGLAAVAALTIVLGLLLVHVLLHVGGVAAADERANVWFAAHRTPFRTHLSLIGSVMSGGVVLPIVVGLTAFALALLRKWRVAAFLVFALGVEAASYRITTIAVPRHRPRVPRLEDLAVNASFPSGHTAASIAVYCGLALLLTSLFRNRMFRVATWSIALALPTFDALSRLYRGMHHPLDVAGGVVLGIASLYALVVACRASGAASRRPEEVV